MHPTQSDAVDAVLPEPMGCLAEASTSVVPSTLALDPAMLAVERELVTVVTAGGATLDAAVDEHLATGGKRLRARLALAAGEVLGVRLEAVVPWAAACELLHNASLIHDDLQDGDTLRRGHPTTWVRYGMEQAVNAGDYLLVMPHLLVDRIPASDGVKWRLSRALAARAADTVRGQAAELDLALDQPALQAAYRAVVVGKTSALLSLPIYGAAVLSGCAETEAHALADEFRALGVLFQLQDDVVDLYGAKGRDRTGCDIREGKISALVVEHLRCAPADTERLVAILRAPRELTTDDDVAWCIERFAASGALDAVLDQIKEIASSVERSGLLAAVPGLRRVALDLVERTLAPLDSLICVRAGRIAG